MNSQHSKRPQKTEIPMYEQRALTPVTLEPDALLAELTLTLEKTKETVQRIEAAKIVTQETMQLEVSV